MQHRELTVLTVHGERDERVAVERREQEIANADEELDGLDVGIALRRGRVLLFLDEERADEAAAEVGEGQALGLEIAVALGGADHEVDERLVGATTVDGERGDARADDDREREEALADDLAEGLEASDPLADAFEPAVGPKRVEWELFFGSGHARLRRYPRGRAAARGVHKGVTKGRVKSRPSYGFPFARPQPPRAPRGPPVHTHRADAAAFAALLVRARGAALDHSHVAEREVVARRIGVVEAREGAG